MDPVEQGGQCLVLCLGNDVRSDDGVAWHVASLLEEDPPPGTVICRSALSGFYLLDEILGFERVVVVDAVRTGHGPPGSVWSLPLRDIHSPAGPSPHAVGFPTVMALGRAMGLHLPPEVHVIAVEVEDMETIGEGLTPAVAGTIPKAAEAVREAVARLSQ